MCPITLDSVARALLEEYPAALHGPLTPLGNCGGFSGASLWRVGENCLRAWSTGGASATRLRWVHRLMTLARQTGLTFVPAVWMTRHGESCVERAGRCWDATSWQPGRADFHEHPSGERLAAACTALARLHDAWATVDAAIGPCPAVRRRLERTAQWHDLLRSGWRPTFTPADPVTPHALRGWEAIRAPMRQVPASLLAWQDRHLSLQPCLCDVWHDHVLFQGEIVTGLIDYGSVRVDHVAADLARLLGSLVGDDTTRWEVGLAAYTKHRALSDAERELARVLDRSGTLLGVANWLRWLYHENRPYGDRAAVARRLAVLVERIERWP